MWSPNNDRRTKFPECRIICWDFGELTCVGISGRHMGTSKSVAISTNRMLCVRRVVIIFTDNRHSYQSTICGWRIVSNSSLKQNNFFYFSSIHSVAGIQASVFSYVSEFHSKKTMLRAVSLVASFMPMAFIILPLIARFLFTKKWKLFIFGWNISVWRIYLLAGNTLNFLVLILVLLLPESPKFLVSVGRKADAMKVLKLIYATNTSKSSDVSIFHFLHYFISFHFGSSFDRHIQFKWFALRASVVVWLKQKVSWMLFDWYGIRRGRYSFNRMLARPLRCHFWYFYFSQLGTARSCGEFHLTHPHSLVIEICNRNFFHF